MDQLTMWSLLVGFVSSNFIIPIIQQPRWSKLMRTLITVAYSIVAGGITAYFAGELDFSNVSAAILVVLSSSIATYKLVAQNLGIAGSIEILTSKSTEVNNP